MSSTISQYGTQLFRPQKNRPQQKIKRRMNPVLLEQLDLGEISTWSVKQQQAARKLLCDYSETFSKNDLDLRKM